MPGRSAVARYAKYPTVADATMMTAIATHNQERLRGCRVARRPRRLLIAHSFGGSVWESNPPPACLEPDTGFEVREAHRVPRRFRSFNRPPAQPLECITLRAAL